MSHMGKYKISEEGVVFKERIKKWHNHMIF